MGFRDKFKNADNALTFNDVILLPGWTNVEPEEALVKTHVTPNIPLNAPFIASPMDTVTESEMAIALARNGCLGALHRNCTAEEEVDMARAVKRAEALIIRDVVTVNSEDTVEEILGLMNEHNISGFPVVGNGDNLTGIVTLRDVRLANKVLKVSEVMTENVITGTEETSLEEAMRILHEHKIEKLPIVDEKGRVSGLMTMKDITLKGTYPEALRDEEGRLICAAATSPFDLDRAKALDAYVDIIIMDVAHFHNKNCFEATKKILKETKAEVIVGNIGTYEAAEDCLTKLDGVAGLRVGIGSGSICSTSVVTRAGAPTLYAVSQAADAVKDYGSDVPIIADGGLRNPGDIAVALAVGASCAMMGNVFAGCSESPGRLVALEGRYYKEYYGMGSPRARRKRFVQDRYSQPSKAISEGVEGWVPYRGPVTDILSEFVGGLKAAMGYIGARTVPEIWDKAKLARITSRGAKEIAPHDVMRPGPNREL
ncbi:IMP dehydrogenase [Candidatus Bathyarchaeota archaeon]|jgi:IMP dehydrogenase|nr:IMP dehydrogenase [Candidatus Bathyarchaeota archaeon]MDP6048285.1 IMP dehydrogenase [Candidatus Bathyarchaeota archaeon]MDP7207150.1 IMP dehydrogenase [Candidatus Bathyarchaeota archaeon]MDP7443786.1 IMP dehydrogenase [Candidatus Bathyarchaeota archaeon]